GKRSSYVGSGPSCIRITPGGCTRSGVFWGRTPERCSTERSCDWPKASAAWRVSRSKSRVPRSREFWRDSQPRRDGRVVDGGGLERHCTKSRGSEVKELSHRPGLQSRFRFLENRHTRVHRTGDGRRRLDSH